MKQLAQFFKTLGDANRLLIIHAIGKNSLSVTEIIQATRLSQTLVSFHLRALRKAGVVVTRRQGPFIFYSLAVSGLYDLIGEFSRLAGFENEITAETRALKLVNSNQGNRGAE
ncbi:ArsR/SmtB family transcription factor [Desulfolithobacter sp.]